MKFQRNVLAFFAAIALLSLFFVPPVSPQAKKIVIDNKIGRPYWQSSDPVTGGAPLRNIVGNLTALGYDVVVERGGINSSILSDASALILNKIKTQAGNYTQTEIDAIVNWMKTGNKFLWVAMDSDYLDAYLTDTGSDFRIDQGNRILAAIGSHLRAELASVESPTWNIGAAAYRVLSNVTNSADPDVAKITAGITKPIYFPGPTVIIFVNDQGTYVSYDQLPKPGLFSSTPAVFWVFKTAPDARIVDGSPKFPPLLYTNGQVGSYVLMAGEKYIYGSSKVVVAGESPIGDVGYSIWTNLYRGTALDGPALLYNTIAWGLTPESAPIPTGYYIVGAIVVIIAAVAVYFFFIRKK
ncbi:MAG TPA: hypothetical protein VEG31_04455 [Thermoproteota archaeon]|nr:hypothetical protein [Thermoproteota archaeon]